MQKVIAPLAILCIFVTIIWFSKGYILGTGESSLPFYLPAKNFQTNLHTWAHDITGNTNPSGVANIPWYGVMTILHLVFGSTITQALFFLGLLLMMSLGMVWFMRNVLYIQNHKALFIGGLFYMANTITVSQVFNRLQYPFMLTYAFLPIWLTLLHLLIERFSNKRLTAILLSSAATSVIFAIPPMALIMAIASATYIAYMLIQNRWYPLILYSTLTKVFLIGLTLVLVHAWWILPFIKILRNTPHLVQEQYNQEGNIWTFHELSDRLGDPLYVLRMQNKEFYLNPPPSWGNHYQSPFFIVISLIPLIFVVLSLRKSIQFERKGFLLTMFGVSIVLAMGSNSPLGFINTILIENIRIFEAFRNPYEKASLLIPLSVAPIIGAVSANLSRQLAIRTSTKTGIFAFSIFTLILCGIYVHPFWTGQVFTSNIPPANNPNIGFSVEVPEDYAKLREFLTEKYQQEPLRVLFLPIGGEGITYNWSYGYSGVELSNDLLGIPSLSMSTGGVQFLSDIVSQIESSLIERPSSFKNILADLRIKYVIIRADVNEIARGFTSNAILAEKINQIPELKKTVQYGKLTVFELDKAAVKGLVTASSSVISANQPTGNIFRKHYLDQSSLPSDSIHNELQKTPLITQHLLSFKLKRGTHVSEPTNRISRIYNEIKDIDNIRAELPHLAVQRNNILYPLIKIKETISLRLANPSQAEELYFTYSAKRLHEAIKAENDQDKKDTIHDYLKIIEFIDAESVLNSDAKIRRILIQKLILEELSKTNPLFIEANQSVEKILESSIQSIANKHTSGIHESAKFNLPDDIDVQLIVEGCNDPTIDINFSVVTLSPESENISRGSVKLQKGENFVQLTKSTGNKICHLHIYDKVPPNTNFQNPEISQIIKKSPAHYQIHVSNATQPYLLTFAETFHPLWQAKIINNGQPLKPHVLVNDFANGWIVEATGNHIIELYFQAEQYYKIGTAVSLLTVAMIVLLNTYQKLYDSFIGK